MMQHHETIKRKAREPAAGSFEALRSEGIEFVQALSGKTWTDYNLHDPGVTILEQLCFALTELGYRAGFPVKDQLTDENRRIDWEKQSLHRPEKILPCRPTTTVDYRVLLLDKLLDEIDLGDLIDDVSVATRPHDHERGNEPIDGLYYLSLRLQRDDEEAKKKVRRIYRAHRNLCEDVEKVDSIVRELCELKAEIQIEGPRDPIDVLTEVYDCCDQHVAGKPHLETFEEMDASGQSLDEILEGPDAQLRLSAAERFEDLRRLHLQRTRVADRAMRDMKSDQDAQLSHSISKLRASVAAIGGVQQVTELHVRDDRGNPLEVGKAYRLQHPDGKGKLKVALFKRGIRVEVAARDVKTRFEDLRRQHRQRTRVLDRIKRLWPMPAGQYRDVQPYYSLQNDLPAIYGVNAQGIPESATLKEKSRAKQLKAYLVLLEQIIANSTFNLDHLRKLFSADTASRESYWWRLLGEESVPGITELFEGKPTTAIQERKEEPTPNINLQIERDVFRDFDDYPSRKGRVLDHLLALYGERLPQNSLRRFADYCDPGELEYDLVEHKAAFLKNIVAWTRDRASGFDYSKPSWNKAPPREGEPPNCSGLQIRIGQLLGFKDNFSRPLTYWNRQLLIAIDSTETVKGETKRVIGTENLERLPVTTKAWPSTEQERQEMHHDLIGIAPLKAEHFSKTLLHAGVKKDRYWSELLGDGKECCLLLELDDDNQDDDERRFLTLGQFGDAQFAQRAACHLRTFLIRLNQKSEGSHVVEHVLFRPTEGGSGAVDPWFFSHRLTVVFPNWSARFQQRAFQRLAEETVQLNCPAHLRARCIWMDFEAMQTFEEGYEAWLAAKIAYCDRPEDGETTAAVDAAAARVMACIKSHWPSEEA